MIHSRLLFRGFPACALKECQKGRCRRRPLFSWWAPQPLASLLDAPGCIGEGRSLNIPVREGRVQITAC